MKQEKDGSNENNMNQLPPGSRALRMLFKEVLQQCPPQDAVELWHGYLEGKTIILGLRQNSHDPVGNKTAFRFGLLPKPPKWFRFDHELSAPKPEAFLLPAAAGIQ